MVSIAKLTSYDIVINHGRVMDPKTRTDIVANVGISSGTICALVAPEHELKGNTIIDATGNVVAPGFVDIHAHEDIKEENDQIQVLLPKNTMRCFLLGGTTTMIGGNCGHHSYPIADYFNEIEDEGCLINYLSFCGHNTFRHIAGISDRYKAATSEQIQKMKELAEQEMKCGALGVSYGIHYFPGSSYEEMLALAKVAAEYGGMTASHARYGEASPKALEAVKESIKLCRESGVPHQYSHIGGMAGFGDIMTDCLDALENARKEGLEINTDNMPYETGMTGLGTAILDEGCWERFDAKPEDAEVGSDVIINGETIMCRGDRFTHELFDRIRPLVLEGKIVDPWVILHIKKPKPNRWPHLRNFCCVASDGHTSVDLPSPGQLTGRPNISGTFARFLGRHVRQEGLVDLMTGLYQSSTLPAQIVGLKKKGRLSVGADADIVVFNPNIIIDKSTYGAGWMTPPEGIEYVLVNGIVAAKGKKIIPDVTAGKAIRHRWKVGGMMVTE